MCPYEGQREQRYQLPDAARGAEMRRLQVKASGLQGAKERLDLPPAPVAIYGFLWVAVCQDEQILCFALTAHIARSHQMQALLTEDPAFLAQKAQRAMGLCPTISASYDRHVPEEPPGRPPGATTSLDGGVFLYANAKGHVPLLQKTEPRLADKLPIGQKRLDLRGWHEAKKALHQRFALGSVGIACLGQELPEYGVGNAFVADGDHEDVDISAPKLPVRPIHRDDEVLALRDKLKQEAAKRSKIKGMPAHKALNAPLVRGWLGPPAQDQRQLRKTDGALHEERQRKSRHELEPCLVDREMLPGRSVSDR